MGLFSKIFKSQADLGSSGLVPASITDKDKFLNLSGLSHFLDKVKSWSNNLFVPKTRTINGKSLSNNVTLSASDVKAIPTSQKGVASGVASLDSSGKIPSSQLPSYVDDVIEGYLSNGKFYKESSHSTQITAESGKIYVDLTNDTNRSYRWGGSAYVEISKSLALGTTSSTAFAGDKGQVAYNHSQSAHAPSNAEANVQSDWNVSSTSSDAYIKNKPTSLPANGGNSDTVNGHTVEKDVPSNAKFTDTVYTHPTSAGNKHIPSGGSSGQILRWSSNGTATWGADKDTTYSTFKGASSSTSGGSGLVPAPASGASNRYLRSDGTWQVPPDTNTTYSNMTAASASSAGKAGLVPAPAAGAQSKYLRGDGTWQTPPNTTYSNATTSSAGLMSSADKTKLDGIASGANKYTLPTASSTTLGGVKTTSTVSSASGYTACPIISGVPYYKDTNTTYTLSSFGISATSTEINQLDGITDNVQDQLDSKANSGHTHNYAGSSSAGGAANSVKSSLTVKLNGGSTEGTNQFTFNGSAAKSLNITPGAIGAATSSHGTHVTYGTSTPLAPGTASVGTASSVSRSDHRHPLQTTVSGNAGSATKLATARTLNGVAFNGTADINIPNNYFIDIPNETDLNTIKDFGEYYAGGGSACTNANGKDHFYLRVARSADGHIAHLMFSEGILSTRFWNGTSWSAWRDVYSDGNKPTPSEIGAAASSHNHSASNITSGTLSISRGGTGATSASAARTALGITPANIGAAATSHTHTSNNITDFDDAVDALLPTTLPNPSSLTISLNGTSQGAYNGSSAKSINITPSSIGAASTSHGTHVTYGTSAPLAPGTASAGTANSVSRSDHKHPLQTTVSGNAGSATKLATSRTIDGVSFNGTANITHYGTCSTSAETVAKTVSCTGFTLSTGAIITVKFTVTNTASNPTLNVNGTGSKAIMYRGSAISAGKLAANRIYTFVYDGTYFQLVGDLDTNTTYSLSSFGITATSSELNKLDGLATTKEELGFLDGVTSNIQTQLNSKASSGHSHSVSSTSAAGYLKQLNGSTTQFMRGDGTWATPPNTTYGNMTGASSSAAGKSGLVPAPGAGKQSSFLRGDGTWVVPTNTTYSTFKAASSSAAGGTGLVPAPATGYQNRFLRGDATWQSISLSTFGISATATEINYLDGVTSNVQTQLNGKASTGHTHQYAGASSAGGSANSAVKLDTSTAGSATQPVYFNGGKPVACTYTLGKSVPSNAVFTDTKYTHPTTSGNKHIPSGGSSGQILRWSADGTAVWGNDNNTTYSTFKGASSSTAGSSGLVPAPASGKQSSYLKGDGTWTNPISDSGWISVAESSLGPEFKFYEGGGVRYRKINNIVEICGVVQPKVVIEGSALQYTIFTLPSGYRPTTIDRRALMQGSGENKWLLVVTTSGDVTFSRYTNDGYINTSTTTWLPFSFTFIAG